MISSSRRRIWSGFAFAILIISTVAIISYDTVKELERSAELVDHTHVVLERLAIFSSDLKDVQRGARGYVLSASPQFLKPYELARDTVIYDLKIIRALTSDNSRQQIRIDTIQTLLSHYFFFYHQLVELRTTSGLDAAVRLTLTLEGKRLMDEMLTVIDAMKAEENTLLSLREEEDRSSVTMMKTVLFTGSGLALVLIIISAFVVMRENSRRRIVEEHLVITNNELNRRLSELKRSQADLQVSQQKFRGMVQSVTDYSIILLDPQGNIASWNEGAKRTKGYEAEEILGKHYSCFYPQEEISAGKPAHNLQIAAETGHCQDEGWRVRKDGSLFWANVVLTALRDENGELTGFTKITRDLTERKKAEEQLTLVIEAVPSALVMVDRDGKIVLANKQTEKLFRYKREELLGKSVDMLVPARYRAAHPKNRDDYFSVPNTRAMGEGRELFAVRKDGSEVPVEIGLNPLVTKDGIFVLASVVDISERKRSEKTLRETMALQRAILDNAAYAIISTTPDGIITTFNPAAEWMLGYTATEVTGLKTPAIIHDPAEVVARAEQFSVELGETIAPGFEVFVAKARRNLPNEHEWTYIRKDGTRFPVLLSVTALRSEDEKIYGFLGLAVDITEAKRAKDELAIAKDKAEAADQLKSSFLATMSHELRTPLNSIIGFTGMIQKGMAGPLTTEQQKQLTMVMNSARHLLNLINDVLDISKIEAGQLEVERQPFEMREAIQKCIDMIAPLAEKRGLTFEHHIAPEVGEIISDRRRIEQVIINLLTNAVKFTDRGTVTLAADVVNSTQTAALRVQIIDTGSGVKPEDIDKLFRPFQQVNSGLSRPHEGTGLGLSICKKLMNLLGGDVTVRSEFGKGSTFEITLPI